MSTRDWGYTSEPFMADLQDKNVT